MMHVSREQFVGISYSELLDENDKLRELVGEMWECFYTKPWMERNCQGFIDRMRELGIEVDE